MTDTVKIERPLFCRRSDDRGGRVISDTEGHSLKVRTRIEDSRDVPCISLKDTGVFQAVTLRR